MYVSDRSTIETLSSANAAGRIHRQHVSAEVSPQETAENTINLQAGETAQENTGTNQLLIIMIKLNNMHGLIDHRLYKKS